MLNEISAQIVTTGDQAIKKISELKAITEKQAEEATKAIQQMIDEVNQTANDAQETMDAKPPNHFVAFHIVRSKLFSMKNSRILN